MAGLLTVGLSPTSVVTGRPIVFVLGILYSQLVALSYSNHLSLEDKLDAMRRCDPDGKWETLDEWRYCTVCKRPFSGRQIEVLAGARGLGPVRLHCPTLECNSTPRDWNSSRQIKVPAETEVSFLFENEETDEIPFPLPIATTVARWRSQTL